MEQIGTTDPIKKMFITKVAMLAMKVKLVEIFSEKINKLVQNGIKWK